MPKGWVLVQSLCATGSGNKSVRIEICRPRAAKGAGVKPACDVLGMEERLSAKS